MKCAKCGGLVVTKKGDYKIKFKYIGPIEAEDLVYHECSKCGSVLFDIAECSKITDVVFAKEKQLLDKLPDSDFITATEASKILGRPVSELKLRTVYKRRGKFSRKSIELYRRKSDGRFRLS